MKKDLRNVRLSTEYILGAVGSGALSKVINNSIMLKGNEPVTSVQWLNRTKGLSLPANGAC